MLHFLLALSQDIEILLMLKVKVKVDLYCKQHLLIMYVG